MAQTYHVTTFGCQMNEHDSEHMRGMLESLGYEEAPEREQADLILFNTCSIRESADNRLLAHLGAGARAQARGPGARHRRRRLLGAVAQGRGLRALPVRRRRVRAGPGPPPRRVPDQRLALGAGLLRVRGFSGELPEKRARDFQGWLQISVGCNCACSYCIVPSTRGREVSRPLADLLEQARRMAADGVREITLLGQNVNSYGRDLRPRARLASRSS